MGAWLCARADAVRDRDRGHGHAQRAHDVLLGRGDRERGHRDARATGILADEKAGELGRASAGGTYAPPSAATPGPAPAMMKGVVR